MICEVGMEFQEHEKKFDLKLKPQLWDWQEVDSGSFSISYAILPYQRESILHVTKVYDHTGVHQEMQYDTLGRIKFVVFTYNMVKVGTSYAFDTLGNIIEVVYERQADKYPICFREALEIVKQKTPKHYTIRTIERDSMMIRNRKVYCWTVTTGEEEKLYWYVYYINAKTGRVIKKGISRVVH